jgi:hypothetical protein
MFKASCRSVPDVPSSSSLAPGGDVREVLLSEPPAWLCQFLWAGLFIGHFRYLADLLERSAGLPDRRFWWLVREEILAYQARFPELAERVPTPPSSARSATPSTRSPSPRRPGPDRRGRPRGRRPRLHPLAGVPHHSQVMSMSRGTRFTGDRVPVPDACART